MVKMSEQQIRAAYRSYKIGQLAHNLGVTSAWATKLYDRYLQNPMVAQADEENIRGLIQENENNE